MSSPTIDPLLPGTLYGRIVVGFQKTDSARTAARWAQALASSVGADLHAATAYDPSVPGAEDDARRHLDSFALASARPVHRHVVAGDPAEALLAVVAQVGADLVVVGNRGMHRARGLLGSVPNTVSHRAPCAVLIVPSG